MNFIVEVEVDGHNRDVHISLKCLHPRKREDILVSCEGIRPPFTILKEDIIPKLMRGHELNKTESVELVNMVLFGLGIRELPVPKAVKVF